MLQAQVKLDEQQMRRLLDEQERRIKGDLAV